MKHEDFSKVEVGAAFDVIEGRILPSLTLLIETAAAAEEKGAGIRADELRALAAELELLSALIEPGQSSKAAK